MTDFPLIKQLGLEAMKLPFGFYIHAESLEKLLSDAKVVYSSWNADKEFEEWATFEYPGYQVTGRLIMIEEIAPKSMIVNKYCGNSDCDLVTPHTHTSMDQHRKDMQSVHVNNYSGQSNIGQIEIGANSSEVCFTVGKPAPPESTVIESAPQITAYPLFPSQEAQEKLNRRYRIEEMVKALLKAPDSPQRTYKKIIDLAVEIIDGIDAVCGDEV